MIKNEEDVKRLLTDSEAYIIASENGVGIYGKTNSILACLTLLIKHCLDNNVFSEELLNESIRLAKMDTKDLRKEALKFIKDKIKNMED